MKNSFSTKGSFKPVAYGGVQGVGQLLSLLEQQFDMQPIIEKGTHYRPESADGGSVTLEPGGQLNYRVRRWSACMKLARKPARIYARCARSQALWISVCWVGFQPLWGRSDISWMPKGRYKIMREYMPKRGSLGLDMMLRSCTVQVNLDYADERDMARKFRTSLALQPIATALFANSPLKMVCRPG